MTFTPAGNKEVESGKRMALVRAILRRYVDLQVLNYSANSGSVQP
jgi:hypothetical protein